MSTYKRGREGAPAKVMKMYAVRDVLSGVDLGKWAALSPKEAIEDAWEHRWWEICRDNPRLHDAPMPPIPWTQISAHPVSS